MNEQQELNTVIAPVVALPPVVVEADEQAVAKPDYTNPLDLALLAMIAKELDVFEQDPKFGWDLTCPTLYKTLLEMVTEICAEMNAPLPSFFLDYAGTNACQAWVNHLVNGTKELHLGTTFIRTQLLDSSLEDALLRHRAFRWALTHEIAHIVDPKLRWWTMPRVWAVRVILQNISGGLIFAGIFDIIFAHIPMLHNFSGGKALLFIATGYFIKITHKLVEVMMHHLFEYTADRLALNTSDQFTTDEPRGAIDTMNSAIAQEIRRQEQIAKDAVVATSKASVIMRLVLPLQLMLLACKQWYTRFNVSLLHPSLENRVAAMNKQLSSGRV
ncbi:hypothetical protein FJ365_03920 [Candidatus Dependentiae bacterium]|nr:hypothetical protein [Candidatus Dependentiae bacterium]